VTPASARAAPTDTGGMTPIVKAATAHDFLALVPRLVGFPPGESIVFVAFIGGRTCGAMRFDLPGRAEQRFHRRIATTLVGTLSKLRGVDAVVPVVYTAQSFRGEHGMPAAAFVRSVIDRFSFSGFDVRDALCVASDGWGSYLDENCPVAGRPLQLIADSTIVDSIPEDDRRRFGTIEEWASVPRVDLATSERVARRLAELQESLAARDRRQSDAWCAGLAGTSAFTMSPLRHSMLAAAGAEAVLGPPPDEIPDETAALLIFMLGSPRLWEALAVQWAFGLDAGLRSIGATARRARDGDQGVSEVDLLILGCGPRPDPERIESATRLVKALAARAPRAERAPVLALLAWFNWALGRSSVARRFVDDALNIHQSHLFASVLGDLLDRGELPVWAFATDEDDDEHDDADDDDVLRGVNY
jgi:hypothetical protein